MPRAHLDDLSVFVVIAREANFTTAAARLGVTTSALSYTMKSLEERLGIRLLTRTTRRVAPTPEGRQLLETIAPLIDQIDIELRQVTEREQDPSGTLRISAAEHAVSRVILPGLARFTPKFPNVKVEVVTDYALTDIVTEQFDAGVRLGDIIDKDMISVPVGPDIESAIVATPDYFSRHKPPEDPADLARHSCINLRLPTRGNLYAWELEKDGREVQIRVEGPLVFNSVIPIKDAALAGLGIAYTTLDYVQEELESGALVRVLHDWTPRYPGYRLYYPSRRQQRPALRALIETLRYRKP